MRVPYIRSSSRFTYEGVLFDPLNKYSLCLERNKRQKQLERVECLELLERSATA